MSTSLKFLPTLSRKGSKGCQKASACSEAFFVDFAQKRNLIFFVKGAEHKTATTTLNRLVRESVKHPLAYLVDASSRDSA